MATASCLAETIEKDFLACAICFEQLTDPVGLPCLHAFCFECLDNWHKTSKDKTKVACPACKATAHVPTGGIRGFPGHFLIKNLAETINMENKAEGSISIGDNVCVKKTVSKPRFNWGSKGVTHNSIGIITQIEKDQCWVDFPEHKDWQGHMDDLDLVVKQICCKVCGKAAAAHCFNCKNNLCSKCHVSHDAFEYMTDHVVASLDDIESGKEIHEGRFCRLHGEQVRYYCETEKQQVCPDCINLKNCKPEHDRISLKDAATKQRTKIQELNEDCDAVNTAAVQSIQCIKQTQQDLKTAKQVALKTLEDLKKDCHRQVDQMVNKHEQEINQLATEREQNMKKVLASLEKQSQELQAAQANTSKLTESKSDFEISYKYASLSDKIEPLLNSEPEMIQDSLGYITFETLAPMSLPEGNVSKEKHWKLMDQFSLDTQLENPTRIDINNENGDVCISSIAGNINVYSSKGQIKHTLQESGYKSFCISPDNRYVTYDGSNINHFDTNGSQLSTTKHGISSDSVVNSSCVDSAGRIILAWDDSTISIHYAEGSLMSQFSTSDRPYKLSTCFENKIIASFWDESLQIMDYSGKNIQVIHKPPSFKGTWDPGCVCCSPHEIFVLNEGGDGLVYRFDHTGKFLGIIITIDDVTARDMALSYDGNRLFVLEQGTNLVKIFQRQ